MVNRILSCASCGESLVENAFNCSRCNFSYQTNRNIIYVGKTIKHEKGLFQSVTSSANTITVDERDDYIFAMNELWDDYDKKLQELSPEFPVILNVRSGHGGFAIDSLKSLPKSTIILGTEFEDDSVSSIANSIELHPNKYRNFYLLAGGLLNAPLSFESVDLVISNQFYIPGQMKELIKKVSNILRPGGRVLIHKVLFDKSSETLKAMNVQDDEIQFYLHGRFEKSIKPFGLKVSDFKTYYAGCGRPLDGINDTDVVTVNLIELIKE